MGVSAIWVLQFWTSKTTVVDILTEGTTLQYWFSREECWIEGVDDLGPAKYRVRSLYLFQDWVGGTNDRMDVTGRDEQTWPGLPIDLSPSS